MDTQRTPMNQVGWLANLSTNMMLERLRTSLASIRASGGSWVLSLLPRSLVGKLLLGGAVLAGLGGLWYTIAYFRRAVQKPRLYYHPSSRNETLLKACPALKEKYWPSFLFYTAHAATVAGTYFRSLPATRYRRCTLKTEDGGQLCLDWVIDGELSADEEWEPERKPTVIIFHGLNGGSTSVYIRHVINAIKDKVGKDNIQIVVMNNRGAGGSELLTPLGYCGAFTEDARLAVRHVRNAIGDDVPLVGVGYSLGANIMLKYVGEEGEDVPLNGAISISNPLDFKASSYHLEKMPIYNAVLTKGCINTLSRHVDVFSRHEAIEIETIFKCWKLRDFDHHFTCKIFGYSSVDEYYDAASSVNYIHRVAVPTLILHAMDDPIIPPAAIELPAQEAQRNPNTIMATVPCGGHVGFPEGLLPIGHKLSWADRVVAEFIDALISQSEIDDEEQPHVEA